MSDSTGQPSIRPFICRQCHKAYTKLEHLSRHERTHANVKPFKCQQCGRSFGRQDVLARHFKLHAGKNHTNDTQRTTAHDRSNQPAHSLAFMPPQDNSHQVGFEEQQLGSSDLLASGDLLEWLMSDLNGTVPLPLVDSPAINREPVGHLSGFEAGAAQTSGNSALSQSYRMIDDLSKRLNSEVYHSGFTTAFLDSCLFEFFRKFAPTFPILHEPTFMPQCSIAPLLLNMVALGSLFVCEKDAATKGELLWRLGHAAVATSWQSLMDMRGPWDACDGVQLVLTALLGQTYALLSSNASIRTTASVFHGLGFYWARSSGMYSVRDVIAETKPSLDMPIEEKTRIWKTWAATEIQRRAILGHYILDGIISQASGSPTSAKHLINSIGTADSDAAFAAKTADGWIAEVTKSPQPRLDISDAFAHILSIDYAYPIHLSQLSISVIVEGLQSLIADLRETSGKGVGTIPRSQIIQALLNIFSGNILPLRAPADIHEIPILIRWHCVFIELAAPSIPIYRWLCSHHQIPQVLGGVHARGHGKFDLSTWAKQADAHRATLHAVAIVRLLDNLPLNQVCTTHLPTAVFTSAMVMAAMCLTNSCIIQVPETSDWSNIWSTSARGLQEQGIEELQKSLAQSSPADMVTVNLLDEMNSLQMILRTVISRWGISAQMCDIIGRLATISRQQHAGMGGL